MAAQSFASCACTIQDWVLKDNMYNWEELSSNPSAIHILEANPEYISWPMLCENPAAIHLLEANSDKIDWTILSLNPNAMNLLLANPDKIDWYNLSENPSAIDYLKANMDQVFWAPLCANPAAIDIIELCLLPKELKTPEQAQMYNISKITKTDILRNPSAIHIIESKLKYHGFYDDVFMGSLSANPNAIHILMDHPEWINWRFLSKNPAAIELLEQEIALAKQQGRPSKVSWSSLCANPNGLHLVESTRYAHFISRLCSNPAAIHVIEYAHKHSPDVINWNMLSANPNAIHLLRANEHKIFWHALATNPNAIPMLEEELRSAYIAIRPPKFYAESLCMNPNLCIQKKDNHLFDYVIRNMSEGCWERLSANPSAVKFMLVNHRNISIIEMARNWGARDYILNDIQFMQWRFISENPIMIDIIDSNPDKIDWSMLSRNPAAEHLLLNRKVAFTNPVVIHGCEAIDVWKLRQPYSNKAARLRAKARQQWLLEEICQKVFHPSRVQKWLLDDEDNDVHDYMP